MATLVRTIPGLVQPEDFNRPDSPTIGNGWTEGELVPTDLEILTNMMIHANVGRVANIKRAAPPVPDAGGLPDQGTGSGSRYNPAKDLMFHVNQNQNNPDSGGGPFMWGSSVWSGFDNNPDEYYHLSYDSFLNQWAIFEKKANISNPTLVASFPEALPAGFWYSLRLVVEHDVEGPAATQRTLEGWGINPPLASGEDLSGDLILKVGPWVDLDLTWVQVNPGATHEWYGILQGWWANRWDAGFCCGTYVRVIDVPVGWSAEVDSRGPVVSVGADIVMPAKSWALPYSTLTIRDDLNVIRLQETPAPVLGWGAGGFGGDVWEIQGTFVPATPEDLACACDPDAAVMHLTWTDISGTEEGYRVYRSEEPFSTGGFSSGFSTGFDMGSFIQLDGDLPPNTEEYDDTDVEPNTRYYYVVRSFLGLDESPASNMVTCKTRYWSDCALGTGPLTWTKFEDPTLCSPEFLVFVSVDPGFGDSFDRSDRPLDGDNGWVEILALGEWDIVSNEANCGDTDNDELQRDQAGAGTDSLNVAVDVIDKIPTGDVNGAGVALRINNTDPVNRSEYLPQANSLSNKYAIFKGVNGVLSKVAEVAVVFSHPYNIRGTLDDDGVDVIVRAILDGIEEVTWTDVSPLRGSQYDKVGMRINNPARLDNFASGPQTVTVIDLPTDYAVSFDNVAYVTETAGVAVLGLTFPIVEDVIYLRDDEGVVVNIHTESVPFVAGSTYRYSTGG